MNQRLNVTLVAVALLVGLFLAATLLPVPYVTYSPGPTVNVLGEKDGKEVIRVSGHKTFRDDGELRMTTVLVTPADGSVSLWRAMEAWLSPEEAVYPREVQYPAGETAEQSNQESAAQMASSQDTAVAAALTELGFEVTPIIQVLAVQEGLPAEGKLKVHDVLLRIGDTRLKTAQDVVDAVTAVAPGQPLNFVVRRGGKRVSVEVTPTTVDGQTRVGIQPGVVGYKFPFRVSLNVGPNIGGPSAGLMFSLGIYDTLTPGSLTDGQNVAGTGTITDHGKVGPIGGIQQKIVAARDAGARLFLVPSTNCGEARGAPNGDMRLVRVRKLDDAIDSVEAWTKDHDATLPTCAAKGAG
ncbi:MAG: PDZ domain-containing protein [Nocardioides sp.]|uniref:YlbL family protein n=1 Tax=Nocardioides sp. TaxID=35761 RepID=UPI0039E6131B